MPGDQGPAVQGALLRHELIRLRTKRGLTQQQVAAALEWSPSKLIRVEGGDSSITKVDLDALLTEYGVTSRSHRERLQALNRAPRHRGWWDDYKDYVSPTYLSYVGYEAGAAFIRQFQTGFIPALLQTPEYSEIVTIAGSADPRRDQVDRGAAAAAPAELARRSAPPASTSSSTRGDPQARRDHEGPRHHAAVDSSLTLAPARPPGHRPRAPVRGGRSSRPRPVHAPAVRRRAPGQARSSTPTGRLHHDHRRRPSGGQVRPELRGPDRVRLVRGEHHRVRCAKWPTRYHKQAGGSPARTAALWTSRPAGVRAPGRLVGGIHRRCHSRRSSDTRIRWRSRSSRRRLDPGGPAASAADPAIPRAIAPSELTCRSCARKSAHPVKFLLRCGT